MKLVFSVRSWADHIHWQESDQVMLGRVNRLIAEVVRSPFRGIGKPEPLRNDMAGWWSRRIDGEHRLVYRVSGSGDDQSLEIASCRYHYPRRS